MLIAIWLNLTLWLSILASLLSCFLVWLWWSNQFRLHQTVKSVSISRL